MQQGVTRRERLLAVGDTNLIVRTTCFTDGEGVATTPELLVAIEFHSVDMLLWEQQDGGMLARLAFADEVPVIAFVENGRLDGRVVHATSVSDLLHNTETDPETLLRLKKRAAHNLGVGFVLSESEQRLLKEAASQEVETPLAGQRKRRKKDRFLELVKPRGTVEAFDSKGRRYVGIPVLESEWQSSPPDTKLILVDSFDKDALRAGTPLEFFVVHFTKNAKSKKGIVTVQATNPFGAKDDILVPTENGTFEDGGKQHDVLIFSTFEELKTARTNGQLKTGSVVVARDRAGIAIGTLAIYKIIEGGGMTTLGDRVVTSAASQRLLIAA